MRGKGKLGGNHRQLGLGGVFHRGIVVQRGAEGNFVVAGLHEDGTGLIDAAIDIAPDLLTGPHILPLDAGVAGAGHGELGKIAFSHLNGLRLLGDLDLDAQLSRVAVLHFAPVVGYDATELQSVVIAAVHSQGDVGRIRVFQNVPGGVVGELDLPLIVTGARGLDLEGDRLAQVSLDGLGMGLDGKGDQLHRQLRFVAVQGVVAVGHLAAEVIAVHGIGTSDDERGRCDAGVIPGRAIRAAILPLDGGGSGDLHLEGGVRTFLHREVLGLGLDGKGGAAVLGIAPGGFQQRMFLMMSLRRLSCIKL